MSLESLHAQLNDQEDYSGKLLVGTVVNNDDPKGTERVKAIIPGIYEDEESCPWIGPLKKSPFGFGKGYGTFGVPAVGSTLIVELQDGDVHHPIYHGVLHLGSHKTAAQKKEFHKDAWGFEDPDHNKLIVDMKAHTTTFESNSKVKFFISASGDLEVTIPEHVMTNIGGNLTAQVGGTAFIQAAGRVDIKGSTIHLNEG